MRARFKGGPQDGELLTGSRLPGYVNYVAGGDDDWWHCYTLRGTEATGYYYEHTGYKLVAPINERVNCPSCGVVLPWPAPLPTHD